MHVFFDTEFTELSQTDSKLISIGFVSQLGLEFYAELADGWSIEDCSKFVVAEVLPHLDGAGRTMSWADLRSQLKAWIESIPEPVELVSDSPEWDWPWITAIFPTSNDWPSNLANEPIRYYVDEIEVKKEKRFRTFRSHHALDDARLMYRGWRRTDWR